MPVLRRSRTRFAREAPPPLSPDDPPPARPLPARSAVGRAARLRARRSIRCARDQVSAGARTVTRKLQDAGFKAFVVGGAVRDLMLGLEPKDFDIATDAHPEEIKPLFRRAFIIGRRFRLVHVHVGQRGDRGVDVPRRADRRRCDRRARPAASPTTSTARRPRTPRGATSRSTRCTSIPSTEEVWDYVGGVADVRARRLKLIGPPVTRYREDPVRMLRAVRLAAKLGLTIDKKTAEPIPQLAELIENVPPARLFDEMQKLLLSGHATRDAAQPARARAVARAAAAARRDPRAAARPAVHRGRAREHRRARARGQGRVAGVPVRDAAVARGAREVEHARRRTATKPLPALFDAMDRVLDSQAKRIAIPRRFEATIKEIWALQPRFEQRAGARPFRLLEHPRFRAAYDFLALRAQAGEAAQELVDWWTRFQDERPGGARSDAAPGRGAEEAPPLARSRPQASRGGGVTADARARPRGDEATRRPTKGRPERRFVAGDDARLRRPRQQPRPSAPAARARRARARTACRARAWSRVSPNYVTAPLARRRRSPTTSTPSPCSTLRLRRARCSTRLHAIERRQRRNAPAQARETRRGRSTSICYYSAAVACA